MVFCTKCGHQNPDSARYCSKCGTGLKEKPKEEWGQEFGKKMEKWGEDFGKSMEQWGEGLGKTIEEECFALPHGGAICGLIIGIIVSLIGYIVYDFHINTYRTTQTGREVLLLSEYPYQLFVSATGFSGSLTSTGTVKNAVSIETGC